MKNSDLLKEAIADAKAVRETAIANAKLALEESFVPKIQSMLSNRIAEEEGGEEMEEPVEEPVMDEMPPEEEEVSMEEGDDYEEKSIEEMDDEDELELEAIIRELEGEEEEPMEEGDYSEEEEMMEEGDDYEEDMDDDISIDEIIKSLTEEDYEEEEALEEEAEADDMAAELEEAMNVIRFLKSKLNEVNLLNAKLLFSNKLFKNHALSETQKMKVIENFDRAETLREVKLVFATLSESFNGASRRVKRTVSEGYGSRTSQSTAPKKEILSEGNALAARWKKLANIKG